MYMKFMGEFFFSENNQMDYKSEDSLSIYYCNKCP